MNAIPTLWQVTEFLWHEAELLDRREYREWLQLWLPDGKYVVPTDYDAVDFEAHINYIYDDQAMRVRRVERLLSGFTTSERPPTRTMRSVSRVRVVAETHDIVETRSSLILVAYRQGRQEVLAGEVSHRVARTSDGLRLDGKVVRLIEVDGNMTNISYLV